MVVAIRGCQGEHPGPHPAPKQVQAERRHSVYRRRPGGEDAALRIIQVRSLVAYPARTCRRPLSALEEIEKRSQALLAKGVAARFIDKAEDAKEVAGLLEQLREAIGHYQVSGYQGIVSTFVEMGGQISQQQAIYDQITGLTVSILWLVSAILMVDPPISHLSVCS